MISAVILTYNEENILKDCLSALTFVDEIIVFDSFSTDRTLDIAKSFDAKVIQRKFDNYASQRNAALQAVSNSSSWILMVDADEIVTSELKTEIKKVVTMQNDTTMYRVRRKDMFQDQWIKQSSGYPTWFPRLFKNGTVTVAREINEEYITTGTEDLLQEHLIHYPFNKGLTWWLDKHNRYSEMEAQKMIDEIKEPVYFKNLFSKDPTVRRKTQKRISYRLPFRPTIVFIAFYVLRGGFLNGKAGYAFCKLRKTYEWMIDIKFKELKRQLKKSK
ncbi:glycosyltransferase family 2 protein [Psychroserpens algicola]|uniref:Glycosyltransferase family 2 protein n=1 Tax=Psychroserpens algicola TaxID=1719034 RepID=A0ABT0H867_9FLAO|nr:glycosyltransferase family 2 protein [Psychroserpens algicola]MCK8480557.1 glycosyltransferase family 2 protein [Psychroserpens algicola]